MTTMTPALTVPGHGLAEVTVTVQGEGRPVLLLHGGAGPRSVAGFAQALAERGGTQVISPTHPGFDGTPRPDWLDGIPGLALLYRSLLDHLTLEGVTVVGNSVGGWIAAELALLGSPRLTGVMLVDAVGIDVPDQSVADVFGLTMDQIAELSYHDPEPFRIDTAQFTDAQHAALAGNRAALRTYGGSMTDPGLLPRLSAVTVPALVVWGESDRICTPAYGRAYAAALPGARFELLPKTGHVPQIENPEPLLALVRDFAGITGRTA